MKQPELLYFCLLFVTLYTYTVYLGVSNAIAQLTLHRMQGRQAGRPVRGTAAGTLAPSTTDLAHSAGGSLLGKHGV